MSDYRQWIEAAVAQQRRAERAEHDLAAARDHVLKYGQHLDGCPRGKPVRQGSPYECTCGFSSAIDSAMFPTPETKP